MLRSKSSLFKIKIVVGSNPAKITDSNFGDEIISKITTKMMIISLIHDSAYISDVLEPL